MALFKISKGKSTNLPTNKVDGYCYVTTNDHKFYVDYTKDDGTLDRFALNAVYADSAGTASKVNNKLTVGSKTFDGSADVTISASDLGLASAMLFLGTTTTAITDGATTNPIIISGVSKTVTSGNVVLYGSKEFVWTGSAWEELGNEGSYKIVQSAVTDPTASGTSNTFIATISQDTNGKITVSKKTVAVTNNTPTLSWGETSTIGSVAGTNLQVKMPEKPDTIPSYSTANNNQFLRIINGSPAWATVQNAEEASF